MTGESVDEPSLHQKCSVSPCEETKQKRSRWADLEDDQDEGDESEYGGDSAPPNKSNASEKLKMTKKVAKAA